MISEPDTHGGAVDLGWLVESLEYARSNGRTRVVGYLEAVLDDAVFEEEITARTASVVG